MADGPGELPGDPGHARLQGAAQTLEPWPIGLLETEWTTQGSPGCEVFLVMRAMTAKMMEQGDYDNV